MYCANTIVLEFGRLLRMDHPKHSLEHCLMGLFGWTNPVLTVTVSGVAKCFLSECDLKRKGKRGHFNSVGGGGG